MKFCFPLGFKVIFRVAQKMIPKEIITVKRDIAKMVKSNSIPKTLGVPMLAANSKCLPSAVTVLASLRRAHSAFCLTYASPAALN